MNTVKLLGKPDRMLGSDLRWTSIPSRGGVAILLAALLPQGSSDPTSDGNETCCVYSRVYHASIFLTVDFPFSKVYPKLREVRSGCFLPSSTTSTHHHKMNSCGERKHTTRSEKDQHATNTPSLLIWVSMNNFVDLSLLRVSITCQL